ncbi:hypothetical protein Cob_v006577 [Colletotrichum orbiculare MAFF 240422]|uniref:Uncharacterized protein n=1 Tax=Colletotrichum orbiculare (strain 104-T / ATCC 96160 / CBS 514.97 / LARS 414 / MAFF 240422) TaxID=1213857 RepID=A0A484FR78_COLOR|nr:hypothetical protein Cob_v006577 [Colletotrichum orbiculare MAFF 240422]
MVAYRSAGEHCGGKAEENISRSFGQCKQEQLFGAVDNVTGHVFCPVRRLPGTQPTASGSITSFFLVLALLLLQHSALSLSVPDWPAIFPWQSFAVPGCMTILPLYPVFSLFLPVGATAAQYRDLATLSSFATPEAIAYSFSSSLLACQAAPAVMMSKCLPLGTSHAML